MKANRSRNTKFRLLAYLMSALLFMSVMSSCQEKRLDRIERESREFTLRNCPKQMDPITTLDSLVFHNDGSQLYKYYYHIGLSDDFADIHYRDSILHDQHSVLEEKMLKAIRASIELKHIKEVGLTICYIYLDSLTGKEIDKYVFTKEQYK